MNKYYFMFGFMEPNELAQLGPCPDDPESSAGIWIWAESEKAAIIWGHEIAERFMRVLYRDDSYSWKRFNYYAGIFNETANRLSPEELAQTPEVRVDEWPDFKAWIKNLNT